MNNLIIDFKPLVPFVQMKREDFGFMNYQAASNFAKELNKNGYGFAKPLYQLGENYSFKWAVFSQQLQFSRPNGKLNEMWQLILAIRKVVDNIKISDEKRIKLNKLMVNVFKTKKWPFNEPSVEGAIKAFSDFNSLLKTDALQPQHCSDLFQFVRGLNKGLREQSMTHQEIAEKIATKANRPLSGSSNLYGRIKELVQKGAESPSFDPLPTLLFCRVFALHAYLYKENTDNIAAQADLKNSMQRLVQTLCAYDRKKDSWFLRDFFLEILNKIQGYSASEYTRFKSLVWVLEALAVDRDFIHYMQLDGCMNDAIKNSLLNLYQHPQTRDAAIDAIVFLGNGPLFTEFLDKLTFGNKLNIAASEIERILIKLNIAASEVGRIFINLNEKLPEDERIYKELYLNFLTKLKDLNIMHLLKPFTGKSELIKRNLEALDIFYIEPLTSFFGNAPFRIATRPDFPGIKLKSVLFKFFSHYGELRVNDDDKFNTFSEFYVDFENGYEELCDLILSKMLECTKYSSQVLDFDFFFDDTYLRSYQSIKFYVVLCLPPERWKKLISEFENPVNLLCFHQNEFFLTIYNFDGKLVLQSFSNKKCLEINNDCLFFDDIDSIKLELKDLLKEPANRDAVSAFTEVYMRNVGQTPFSYNKLINFDAPEFINRIKYFTANFSY